METTAVKLYSLDYRDAKTYLAAALFVAGNIVLPQICHLVPQGGLRWLPIYFFTLVGAYKYGWRVGLLTAVLSPAVNSALFGMPAAAVLLFYQTAGTLGEWAFTGSAAAAVQDFRIGIPGMLAQAAGGYLIINYLLRK